MCAFIPGSAKFSAKRPIWHLRQTPSSRPLLPWTADGSDARFGGASPIDRTVDMGAFQSTAPLSSNDRAYPAERFAKEQDLNLIRAPRSRALRIVGRATEASCRVVAGPRNHLNLLIPSIAHRAKSMMRRFAMALSLLSPAIVHGNASNCSLRAKTEPRRPL